MAVRSVLSPRSSVMYLIKIIAAFYLSRHRRRAGMHCRIPQWNYDFRDTLGAINLLGALQLHWRRTRFILRRAINLPSKKKKKTGEKSVKSQKSERSANVARTSRIQSRWKTVKFDAMLFTRRPHSRARRLITRIISTRAK